MQQCIAEVVVSGDYSLNQAISDIRFYWNLAQHKDETILVEIWSNPKGANNAQGDRECLSSKGEVKG